MTKPTSTTPDEATAVVEYTNADDLMADAAARTMRPGGLGHYDVADLLAASAVVDRYLPAGRVAPLAVPVETLADTIAASSRLALTRTAALRIAREQYMRRVTDKVEGSYAYRMARPITLTTDPDPDPTAPVLFLIEIDGDRAATVVLFPTEVYSFTNRDTGEVVTAASHFNPEGYAGIGRYWSTIEEADRDFEELRDALTTLRRIGRTLQRDDAHEPDPVRTVGMDYDSPF